LTAKGFSFLLPHRPAPQLRRDWLLSHLRTVARVRAFHSKSLFKTTLHAGGVFGARERPH